MKVSIANCSLLYFSFIKLLLRNRGANTDNSRPHLRTTNQLPESPNGQNNPVISPRGTHHRRLSGSFKSPTLSPSVAGSYFSAQPASSGTDARSPAFKRPPASRSSHGIETTNGPPPALITRGSYTSDVVRKIQSPSDFACAQQQLTQFGVVSPGSKEGHSRRNSSSTINPTLVRTRRGSEASTTSVPTTPGISRHKSAHSASGMAGRQRNGGGKGNYSDYDSGTQDPDVHTLLHREDTGIRSGGEGEGGSSANEPASQTNEDLFLNLAQDSPQRDSGEDAGTRIERRRSRIARATHSQRQSLPANSFSPSATDRIPNSSASGQQTTNAQDSRVQSHYRRASQLPSPSVTTRAINLRDLSPASSNPLEVYRARQIGVSPQSSFSGSRAPDLPSYGRRRPSMTDPNTPSMRTHYRPSNLNYSSSYGNDSTSHLDTPPDPGNIHGRTQSRTDGTESVESATAASTVWDELDELKSRIRNSAAAMANDAGERPRTATTTQSISPSEAPAQGLGAPNIHPLLHQALAKCKTLLSPALYRSLEAAASEALELAALTGSAGPQGTAYTVASIINGATVPDRHIRRKADNMCKSDPGSPAIRTSIEPRQLAKDSPRTAVRLNGESPERAYSRQARVGSLEPELAPRNSPSRAMERVEERRRASLYGIGSASNSPRESNLNYEARTPTQAQIPRQLDRAGTSLLRSRHLANEDDEEDPTLRAPSRAMTDIARARSQRVSREYTSQHPLPETPVTSLRQPNGNARPLESSRIPGSSLRRDGNRRYLDRSNPPSTYERDQGAANTASLAILELSEPLTGWRPARVIFFGSYQGSKIGVLSDHESAAKRLGVGLSALPSWVTVVR
ncbi:hypothetical protein M501DRAFT_1027284 [Patellaria atrata CBS 101060]|uniref:Uncharacterized protein n=1 Tax=Patellaria atrata CBS 101060 TaxID=1346257 RepID=A0A9P4S3H3_9PEZI|nr:hypothetical protein M501DRAFT_1027284 [Patellaria atrata CBS 101060]